MSDFEKDRDTTEAALRARVAALEAVANELPGAEIQIAELTARVAEVEAELATYNGHSAKVIEDRFDQFDKQVKAALARVGVLERELAEYRRTSSQMPEDD